MWPRREPALAVLALLGLGTAACGSTTQRRGQRKLEPCAVEPRSTACLQFVEQLVGVRSVALSTRVAPQIAATCADAARTTRIDVVCPPLVPADGVSTNPPAYGPQLVDRQMYSASINNGQIGSHIHWEFGAGRGPATSFWYFDRNNWDARPPKLPPRLVGRIRYLGYPITVYRFPDSDGQLEGHDAAFATAGGITYFVSIHGHTHDDADIAMLLAILLARRR